MEGFICQKRVEDGDETYLLSYYILKSENDKADVAVRSEKDGKVCKYAIQSLQVPRQTAYHIVNFLAYHDVFPESLHDLFEENTISELLFKNAEKNMFIM